LQAKESRPRLKEFSQRNTQFCTHKSAALLYFEGLTCLRLTE
jgi:membrane-anchored protein YejM (alkaline phosphatase superfamily)